MQQSNPYIPFKETKNLQSREKIHNDTEKEREKVEKSRNKLKNGGVLCIFYN